MTESQAIEAVYENGIFRPVRPVTGLVEHSKARLAIEYETQTVHPLAQFAGILSNEEAEEVQTIFAEEWQGCCLGIGVSQVTASRLTCGILVEISRRRETL